jgi:hypothetical protein
MFLGIQAIAHDRQLASEARCASMWISFRWTARSGYRSGSFTGALPHSVAHFGSALLLHTLLESIHDIDDGRSRFALRRDLDLRRSVFDLCSYEFVDSASVFVRLRLEVAALPLLQAIAMEQKQISTRQFRGRVPKEASHARR